MGSRERHAAALGVPALAALLAAAALAGPSSHGALTQLPGRAGCISENGADGRGNARACGDGRAVSGAFGIAASRDGGNVYVASSGHDGVSIFARDVDSGELTQLPGLDGCVTQWGDNGHCEDGRALG
jgi:DNA-binding beta-propeller fold protein YncE